MPSSSHSVPRVIAGCIALSASLACGDSGESGVAAGGDIGPGDIAEGPGDTRGAAPPPAPDMGALGELPGTAPTSPAPAESSTGSSSSTLETASGCAGVYNPGQLLRYDLRLADADWQALLADATNDVYFPAEMRCEGGAPLSVSVRRKRSGGTTKVGLKVDINRQVDGQAFHGLKKLSLESGISEGDAELTARSLLSEYLAWRLMSLSGAITGRAAMARVSVNEVDLGVYVNVEQVDKAFLASRLGDDSGWLFKKSGNDAGDGYQTREGEPNPYAANLCFWDGAGCEASSADAIAATLPLHLDIDQLLRVAAVQALMANTDAFPLKNNNVIFYDWAGGGRLYFPWDLDTTMSRTFDAFTGTVPGGTRRYMDILLSNWRADYVQILSELVDERLTLEVILAELDSILRVAGPALDADAWLAGGSSDPEQLGRWWRERHAAIAASIEAP